MPLTEETTAKQEPAPLSADSQASDFESSGDGTNDEFQLKEELPQTEIRQRTHSLRERVYSHASAISVRTGTTLMRFFKSCNGIGVILGLMCALCYSLGGLIVKILNINYQLHPFMLSAIRHCFLVFSAGPQVAYCKAPYGGRTKREWIFLLLRAVCGGVAITFNFMALSYMPLGDVAVIFATTPAFTTIFSWIILKEKVRISDIPCLLIAFLGVAFILRPPFIFTQLFPASLMASSKDLSTENRLIGSALALCGAIVQSGIFLSLRQLRQTNYATISFIYAVTMGPILLIVAAAIGKVEMPPCYLDRLMAIGIAMSAQGGHIFITLASKFIPPGIVSLTRSAEVAFGFLWQVAFLGVAINVFSMIGLALVLTSMAFLSVRQVIIEKYSKETPTNKFTKFLLIISR